MTRPILQIAALSKAFAGQPALDGVDLEVESGEVHALLGQNGSGKSTLVKILAGYHTPEPGARAWVDGEELDLGSSQSARACGIRFVHQDLGLVETISTVENLALGRGFTESSAWRIRWGRESRRAREAVARLGFEIDVRRPVAELTAAERTGVAIARALIGWEDEVRLLVLDEPTAALPVADVDRLFAAVRSIRGRGLSVLFVSHHLEETFEIGDRVTILRDGRKIATEPVAGLDEGRLAELIVGRTLIPDGPGLHSGSVGEDAGALLRAERISGRTVADVSLTVAPGEVLGVTGLRGSGADEIAGLIAGKHPRQGPVSVDGASLIGADPRDAQAKGVALVPGDRLVDGIVTAMTVRENITLTGVGAHMHGPRLSRASERQEARQWIERLGIVTTGPEASILTLSGGNQQKVLLARALRTDPRVLVLDDPTKGVDVGAKAEIHRLVADVARGGSAVLIASSDTEELVTLCDRVLVMRDGRVARALVGDTLNSEEIEHAQLGGVPAQISEEDSP